LLSLLDDAAARLDMPARRVVQTGRVEHEVLEAAPPTCWWYLARRWSQARTRSVTPRASCATMPVVRCCWFGQASHSR
jgi:hypothetical protein